MNRKHISLINNLSSGKCNTVNPLLSPPFHRRKVNKPPSPSPFPSPSPSPPLFTNKRGLISYGLFRLEIHIVFGPQLHDLQPHVLNFFNFMP